MNDLAIKFTPLTVSDEPYIEKLDERTYGPGRYARTAYRLRESNKPDYTLSYVARIGPLLIGSNIITHILIGSKPALLLGPLTVEVAFRSQGVGESLVKYSLEASRAAGHDLVLLVGDQDYYSRMGFICVPKGHITMPGPVDPDRLLYYELKENALNATQGRMRRI